MKEKQKIINDESNNLKKKEKSSKFINNQDLEMKNIQQSKI